MDSKKQEKFRSDLDDDIDSYDDESSQVPGTTTKKVQFSCLEIQILSNLLFDEKDVIECSETSGVTPELVRSTWKIITGLFANHMKSLMKNPVTRTEKQLRNLWSNMKAAARKIDSTKKIIDMKTGNKPKLKLSERQEAVYNAVTMIMPELDFTLNNPFDSTSAYENNAEYATEENQLEYPDKNENFVQLQLSSSSRTPLKINTSSNSPQKSQSASSTFKGKGSEIRKLIAMPQMKNVARGEKSTTAEVPSNSMKRPSFFQENANPEQVRPTNKKSKSEPSGSNPPNMDDSKFDDLKKYQDEMYRGKISVLKKEDQYWSIKCQNAELEQTTQKLEMIATEKKMKYYAAKCRKDLGLDEADELADVDEI